MLRAFDTRECHRCDWHVVCEGPRRLICGCPRLQGDMFLTIAGGHRQGRRWPAGIRAVIRLGHTLVHHRFSCVPRPLTLPFLTLYLTFLTLPHIPAPESFGEMITDSGKTATAAMSHDTVQTEQ